MKVVVDASVAVAFVRRQETTPAVTQWIRRWAAMGGSFVVPRLFWWEVSNPLMRRWSYTAAQTLEAIHQLESLAIETIDPDRATLVLSLGRAEHFTLSTYDACYLAIADMLDLPLVSLDVALSIASGDRWIDPRVPLVHRLSEASVPYGAEPRSTWPDYSGAAAFLAKLRADEERAATR